MPVPTSTPIVVGDHSLVSGDGRLGEPPRSTLRDVGRILDQALAQAPANGLVIHFHGGLVPRDRALRELVGEMGEVYRSAAAYPLFFVWEPSFQEALLNNRRQLLGDPAFKELVKKVSEWALKKISFDGGVTFRGGDGVEIDDIDAFRREFDDFFNGGRDDPPSESVAVASVSGIKSRAANLTEEKLAREMLAGLTLDPQFRTALATAHAAAVADDAGVTKGAGAMAAAAPATCLSQEAIDAMFTSDAGGADIDYRTRGALAWIVVMRYIAKITLAVIRRYRDQSDHGPYCTVVEEVLRSAYGDLVGATVWNAMKGDTLDSFGADDVCCGSAVLRHLVDQERAGKGFAQLTLVGHSTGAIYISHFLDMAKALRLRTPIKVAFLAPAITCERFAETIAVHDGDGLADFRMFAMTDALERRDAMLRPVYTSSLLYFVSGLLEGRARHDGWQGVTDMPLVGMQRYLDGAAYDGLPAVATVRAFLHGAPRRMVWSRQDQGGAGMNSGAISHGGFDEDPPTRASLVAFIGERHG